MSSTRLSRALAGLSNPFECRRFVVLLVLQPRTLSPARGLGSSQFARHYFGNLVLISSRRATEMFQFTRCPPSLPMCSAGGHQPSRWWGCPIRILKAHRLHAAPLERFAGLRVLLRSLAPRHPPRTLSSLFSSSSSLLGVHPDTWSVCLSVCASSRLATAPRRTARSWPAGSWRLLRRAVLVKEMVRVYPLSSLLLLLRQN